MSAWQQQNEAFCRQAAHVGFGDARVVYGYNGAALELFTAARTQGRVCVLDQTAAATRHNASLLQRESGKWPRWSNPNDDWRAWEAMASREEEEWKLADAIICGSPYVKETVAGVDGPAERCHVVPYSTTSSATATPRSYPKRDRPLRVLFVGTLGLRKGLPYLHEAAKLLGNRAELRVVGPSELPAQALELLASSCHVYGPVPRQEVVKHYRWADLFALPTLSEGSANVCFEALGHALPIVTTHEAGSVVTNEREGLLIPGSDGKALANAICHIAETAENYASMSAAALAQARAFTSERYARELLRVIDLVTGTKQQ